MSDDIDALAAASYAAGNNAIDEAVDRVALLFETRDEVIASRAKDPNNFPGFGRHDAVVVARRAIASLLDAGWKPPTTGEVQAAAAHAREHSRRFDEWRDGLSSEDRTRAFNYFAEHGEFPPDLRPPRADT